MHSIKEHEQSHNTHENILNQGNFSYWNFENHTQASALKLLIFSQSLRNTNSANRHDDYSYQIGYGLIPSE